MRKNFTNDIKCEVKNPVKSSLHRKHRVALLVLRVFVAGRTLNGNFLLNIWLMPTWSDIWLVYIMISEKMFIRVCWRLRGIRRAASHISSYLLFHLIISWFLVYGTLYHANCSSIKIWYLFTFFLIFFLNFRRK